MVRLFCCDAVLNHIGSQFLPMGPGYRQRSVTDVRPDSDLAREAKRAFGRHEDVLLARDFVSLKVMIVMNGLY